MELLSFYAGLQNQLEQFLQLICDSRGHSFDPKGRQSDIRHIAQIYQRDGGDFWVMQSGGAIIGCIALKALDPQLGIAEVKRYFVSPARQGQGLGQKLIAHALAHATKNQFVTLRLDTMKSSHAALHIFKKIGFYEIAKYNDNDVAEIFMERTLP